MNDYPDKCPKCHNENVWKPINEKWLLAADEYIEIIFCPYCGCELDKAQKEIDDKKESSEV